MPIWAFNPQTTIEMGKQVAAERAEAVFDEMVDKVRELEGKKSTKSSKSETLTLPSGKVATVRPFKFLDAIKALPDVGDQSMVAPRLIARTTAIGGKAMTIEDVMDLDGEDVQVLEARFSADESEPGFLPSGKPFEIRKWKMRDRVEAQRRAGKSTANIIPHLISIVCKIDGKAVMFDDLMHMGGMDGLALMDAFQNPTGNPTPTAPE